MAERNFYLLLAIDMLNPLVLFEILFSRGVSNNSSSFFTQFPIGSVSFLDLHLFHLTLHQIHHPCARILPFLMSMISHAFGSKPDVSALSVIEIFVAPLALPLCHLLCLVITKVIINALSLVPRCYAICLLLWVHQSILPLIRLVTDFRDGFGLSQRDRKGVKYDLGEYDEARCTHCEDVTFLV